MRASTVIIFSSCPKNQPFSAEILNPVRKKGSATTSEIVAGLSRAFFYADITPVKRIYGGNERPAQKRHGEEENHGIGGRVRPVGEERFEYGHSQKRAVGKNACYGSHAVTHVVALFAEYKAHYADERELERGDQREKYQKVYAKFGRELRTVEGIQRQKGLAYVHQQFGKCGNAVRLYRLYLYEYISGHCVSQHYAHRCESYQKFVHFLPVTARIIPRALRIRKQMRPDGKKQVNHS